LPRQQEALPQRRSFQCVEQPCGLSARDVEQVGLLYRANVVGILRVLAREHHQRDAARAQAHEVLDASKRPVFRIFTGRRGRKDDDGRCRADRMEDLAIDIRHRRRELAAPHEPDARMLERLLH
jgi:hypothetical protein